MDLRLVEGCRIEQSDGALTLNRGTRSEPLPEVGATVRDALLGLGARGVDALDLERQVFAAEGAGALAHFYQGLEILAAREALRLDLKLGGTVAAEVLPLDASFARHAAHVSPDARYRLTRFAVLRRRLPDGFAVETPLGRSSLVTRGDATRLVFALSEPITLAELADRLPQASGAELERFLELLLATRFIGLTDAEGRVELDEAPTLRHWDHHDLYFHSRSRRGRRPGPFGATYRFEEKLPPQPAVREVPSGPVISLPRPDLDHVAASDPSLTSVLEGRTSVRSYGSTITIDELGSFLFRTSRNRHYRDQPEYGGFTSRPYPSGGASYELELYLTIEACEGLERGLYYYDPQRHAAVRLSGPNEHTNALLQEAFWCTGEPSFQPQILISIAARFQRVQWKYEAMAYSVILKNVGALYQTFYLVATAMGLSPCGLGAGDSDVFCRAAGTDYLRETTVGEFLLGGRRA